MPYVVLTLYGGLCDHVLEHKVVLAHALFDVLPREEAGFAPARDATRHAIDPRARPRPIARRRTLRKTVICTRAPFPFSAYCVLAFSRSRQVFYGWDEVGEARLESSTDISPGRPTRT